MQAEFLQITDFYGNIRMEIGFINGLTLKTSVKDPSLTL